MDENRGIWRGKPLRKSYFVEGYLSDYSKKENRAIIHEPTTMESYEVDTSTLGACSGETDINGKKVFEGDICVFKSFYCDSTVYAFIGDDGAEYNRGVVEYKNGEFGILAENEWFRLRNITVPGRDLVVISNIYDNPDPLLKTERFYVIDTETTGLNPDEDEILQLSIVDESGCIICDRLFRPERHESWEKAEEINHITPSMVKREIAFKQAVPQLNAIFAQCGTIIGYNTGFDLAFLQKAGVEFREDIKVIDVQAIFTPIAGEWDWEQNKYKWQSLVKCAEYCGYEWRGNAHNSLADALATLHCYKTLAAKNGVK